jgi:hypothetical protein
VIIFLSRRGAFEPSDEAVATKPCASRAEERVQKSDFLVSHLSAADTFNIQSCALAHHKSLQLIGAFRSTCMLLVLNVDGGLRVKRLKSRL